MKWRTTERYFRELIARKSNLLVPGQIFFVVDTGSQYESWIQNELDIPAELLYYDNSGLANAYTNLTTRKNDVVLVFPGLYTLTSEIAWAKDNCHVFGISEGLPHGDWTLTVGAPVFYTATITQANILNLTGERNTFHNVIFENYGANAACLNAVTVNGYGNSFYNCGIHGSMTTAQAAQTLACSLNIAAGGFYSYFEDCLIGQTEWGTRSSATSGVLYFSGAASPPPAHGHFRNCQFYSAAATAGVPMVYMGSNQSLGRLWRFTSCLFYNFWTNWAGMCDSVFQNPASGQSTCSIVLEDCSAVGYTEWQQREFKGTTYTNEGWVMSNMPITGTAGGLTKLPTGTVGN